MNDGCHDDHESQHDSQHRREHNSKNTAHDPAGTQLSAGFRRAFLLGFRRFFPHPALSALLFLQLALRGAADEDLFFRALQSLHILLGYAAGQRLCGGFLPLLHLFLIIPELTAVNGGKAQILGLVFLNQFIIVQCFRPF